ncbi:MAG: hypothetical protein U5L96_05410 [Owenweeksia sp.]|nr:hypothetical protein [Owenweeksia sp.]
MWIVVIGIGLTYFSVEYPYLLDPLPKDYLISIPDNFISELAFPDFGKLGTIPFWSAVVSLTFISVVESLLSVKGIDRLDPENKRSNVNKDLQPLAWLLWHQVR